MIDIHYLRFRYAGQKQPVFSDFTLKLSENRLYGLLGKNGTGKSTLLYLISGLLRPQAGTVTLSIDDPKPHQPDSTADSQTDGPTDTNAHLLTASERRPEMLRELFLVPEEFNLPSITLDAYVRQLAPFYPRFSRDILERCLKDFDLTQTEQLGALSMGQKKKVLISIALATNTRYLLMDEPTNGLDIPSKSQFRRTMAANMTDDRTVIISTHQVHDVESLLDHLVIIDDNRLLLNESVADISNRYVFEVRTPQQTGDDVVYAEPSLQGNLVLARRQEQQTETAVNLELLFNAVTKGLLT